MRVRLFENRVGGTFYRKVWIATEHRYDVASLKTKDRDEAERRGKELLAALITNRSITQKPANVTLSSLWKRYSTESQSFKACAKSTRKDYRCRANVLMGFFGEHCDVTTLTPDDFQAYVARRRAGGIVSRSGTVTHPVRARSVEADIAVLNIMLRWATTVREQNGERWLRDNPLHGIRRVREQNPRRPVASIERYEQTRQAMQELVEQSESEAEHRRWVRMEFALVLAKATGRRLSAIRHLRWEDFDLSKKSIRWRAEHDKKRHESVIPLPDVLVAEIEAFQRRLGAIGGWVFARPSDGLPMDRHLFDEYLTLAEQHGELEKLEGGLLHPYRRMWATCRDHLPLKQVAEAGGWKDTETLLRCYQQPDRESLLAVMNDERLLRECAVIR